MFAHCCSKALLHSETFHYQCPSCTHAQRHIPLFPSAIYSVLWIQTHCTISRFGLPIHLHIYTYSSIHVNCVRYVPKNVASFNLTLNRLLGCVRNNKRSRREAKLTGFVNNYVLSLQIQCMQMRCTCQIPSVSGVN